MQKTKLTIFLAIISLAFFGMAGVASAAVEVLGVTGDLTNGATVTVTGTGFGTKTTATPISWDDFEGGTDGNQLGSPVIGPTWTFLTQAPNPSYSTQNKHSGLKSALIQWKIYSISSFGWDNKGPYGELYLSFWRYMDPQVPAELPFNHKILYLFGDHNIYPENTDSCGFETPQFMIGAVMWNSDHWRYAVQSCPTSQWVFPAGTPDNWAKTIQKWQRWEVYAKLDSPYTESNGQIKGWIDGQLIYNLSGLNLTDVNGLFKGFRLGNMFQGYHPDGTDKSYFDDVYVDFTQARIEIGDAPTWSANTHREIQIPSAWSATSTTITLNQGSFDTLEGKYLYVIDADGNVNANGYLLTTADTTPPSAPMGLVVD